MTSDTSLEPTAETAAEADAPTASVSRRRFATGLAAIVPALAAGSVIAAEPAQADPRALRADREGRVGIGTDEPDAPLHVEGEHEAIVGHSGHLGVQGAGSVGVHGEAIGPAGVGVYGFSAEPRGRAFAGGARGAESYGLQVGVAGHHSHGVFSEAGAADSTAVYAVAHSPRSHGVYGAALAPDSAGIFADAREAASGAHALWAEGRSHVNAEATHSGAGFKIDHPDDPAGRYLSHAAVESHERKTVYDGVASLDAAGRATVKLPHWFESLNADVRYQLTAIGAAMPNLHVSRQIRDNSFAIAGGTAHQRVSWQVTGIRQDIWAAAHPLAVEERKTAGSTGHMLHPELHAGAHPAVHPRPAGPASG
jgi:hypothetical protein